jgi:PKD repeat protein/dienelactone hydrolase
MVSRNGAFVAVLLAGLLTAPAALAVPASSFPDGPDLNDGESGAPSQGRSVERPDHNGPWANAGFMYYRFKGSTKTYDIGVKIFYPAQSSGENTTPDATGAPFPLLVMLPPMGGPEESYNNIAPQIVSWGYVCMVVGPNWNDFGNSANSTDINELLDYVEAANATPGHKLHTMSDRDRVGIMGYSSGGGLAVIDAALVGRIRALSAFAPAIGDSTLDILSQFFRKPFLFQAGEFDDYYNAHAIHGYQVFSAPKSYLHTRNGSHGGPFFWDCVISFFQRYLRSDARYDTFLYGDEAFKDMAGDKYFLNFRLENGTFFPPVITPSASATSIDENGVVDFNATWDGFLPLGHPSGSFNWDFDGDGAADYTDPQSPAASHRFVKSGFWKAAMWYGLGAYAINGSGPAYIEVRNLPPEVSIRPDYSGAEDDLLQFTAEARDTSGSGEPIELAWDFGDGATAPFSAQTSATHAYTRAGNYTLRVTARDRDGATAAARANVSVRNIAPAVSASGGGTVMKDEPVSFNATMRDTPSDTPGLQCRWDFGDGLSSDWGTETSATHIYTRSGSFTATFHAIDGDQALTTATVPVAVGNGPPSASITAPAANATLLKDREVLFFGTGRDTPTDNATLEFRWDFGDGNATDWSFRAEASHTYTISSNITVRLLVRDGEGALGGSSMMVVIGNTAPKVRLLAPDIAGVDEDRQVRFQASGEDTESDQPFLNYTWTIGNATFFGDTVNMAFTAVGVVNYTIVVRDVDGAEASANGSLEVRNIAPALSAELSPLVVMENGTVNFSATATDTASDRNLLSFRWLFGDGSGSSNASGTHRFLRPGTYTVKVSVSDDEDGTDERSFTVTVQPLPKPPHRTNGTGEAGSGLPLVPVVGALIIVAAAAAVAATVLRRKR